MEPEQNEVPVMQADGAGGELRLALMLVMQKMQTGTGTAKRCSPLRAHCWCQGYRGQFVGKWRWLRLTQDSYPKVDCVFSLCVGTRSVRCQNKSRHELYEG